MLVVVVAVVVVTVAICDRYLLSEHVITLA